MTLLLGVLPCRDDGSGGRVDAEVGCRGLEVHCEYARLVQLREERKEGEGVLIAGKLKEKEREY